MPVIIIARIAQVSILILAAYTVYLSVRRLPIVSALRFRADHIYYAIVAILLLSFGTVYLQVQALTSDVTPFWWVIFTDRLIQLALFIGVLNCACECTSGENDGNSVCGKKH